ncbi:MAG TPA: PilZ domain-containing protein [Solirubrobacteraceae bacterium]|jgi:hypothetical protein
MTIESPPLASSVTLILPDREMLPGRVDAVGEKALDLAMFAAPRTPLRQVQRSRLFLEFINEHGVCRMTGSVEAVRRAGYDDEPDVRDVVRFTFAGPPQLLQRREFVRARHVARVDLTVDEPGAAALTCATVDLSGGGMKLRGLEDVAVDTQLHFRLASPEAGGTPISGRCRVVHVTDEGDVGVQFTAIAETDRDRLVTFAYARELVAREWAMRTRRR